MGVPLWPRCPANVTVLLARWPKISGDFSSPTQASTQDSMRVPAELTDMCSSHGWLLGWLHLCFASCGAFAPSSTVPSAFAGRGVQSVTPQGREDLETAQSLGLR